MQSDLPKLVKRYHRALQTFCKKRFIDSERKTVNIYSYFYSTENSVHTSGKLLEDSVMIPNRTVFCRVLILCQNNWISFLSLEKCLRMCCFLVMNVYIGCANFISGTQSLKYQFAKCPVEKKWIKMSMGYKLVGIQHQAGNLIESY